MHWRMYSVLFITLFCAVTSEYNTNLDTSISSATEEIDLANVVNNFGYKLLKETMKQNENKNIVISPIGIAGLLAMTLLGSVGSTYDELAEIMGFSQDILINRKNHEQFGKMLENLNNNDTTTSTLYADAIFVDAHSRLHELYRSYLKRVYHGDVLTADFIKSDKVKEMINEWVKTNTNGKIEDFLKQSLPIETKVVLLSALYFSGQWAQPFIPEQTRKLPFKKTSGEIMTDLMLNAGDFGYISSIHDDLQMIALPYNDSITTMYALKPRQSTHLSIQQLMERLNYSKINYLIDQMSKKKCVIRFPKMELKTSINLEKALKAVGVKSMFTPGKANFALMVENNSAFNETDEELMTRINNGESKSKQLKNLLNNVPNPGVYVDSVIHDVKMTINEYGTEAVAATSGILARSAELFYADSPFYIFIRNEKTKLVTFSAVIVDPNM